MALPLVTPSDPSNPIGTLNAVGMSNFEVPYVNQFNLNLQRELPLGLVSAVSYVGQRGNKQFFPNQSPDLNAPAPAIRRRLRPGGVRRNAAEHDELVHLRQLGRDALQRHASHIGTTVHERLGIQRELHAGPC